MSTKYCYIFPGPLNIWNSYFISKVLDLAGDFVPTRETHKNSIPSCNCIDITESPELNSKGKQKCPGNSYLSATQKSIYCPGWCVSVD